MDYLEQINKYIDKDKISKYDAFALIGYAYDFATKNGIIEDIRGVICVISCFVNEDFNDDVPLFIQNENMDERIIACVDDFYNEDVQPVIILEEEKVPVFKVEEEKKSIFDKVERNCNKCDCSGCGNLLPFGDCQLGLKECIGCGTKCPPVEKCKKKIGKIRL